MSMASDRLLSGGKHALSGHRGPWLHRQGSPMAEDSQPCTGLRDASRSFRHRYRHPSGRRSLAASQLRDL